MNTDSPGHCASSVITKIVLDKQKTSSACLLERTKTDGDMVDPHRNRSVFNRDFGRVSVFTTEGSNEPGESAAALYGD